MVMRSASSPTIRCGRVTSSTPFGRRWSKYSSNASVVYRLFSASAKAWPELFENVSAYPMWITSYSSSSSARIERPSPARVCTPGRL